ncbi:MAG: ABC-2 type transport system ATP-binding protein [Glaciecola sp.]|jgi:ABC-2 type transport system ATP-binding protein
MEYVIEALHVKKYFSGHKALNDVSIKIPKGEIFGLLGPNGAGKTTFIRCLNRILLPDSGTIKINDEEVTDETRVSIGYLPEERGLYKKMKVGEHLIYLARLKGMSKLEAQNQTSYWLNKFDIEAWKNKSIEELSKGMAQKIQFIATVIHKPEVLILDEPFSGFDPINAELIKQEILEQQASGVSIILSTHNMSSVEELCTRIALLNDGEIILEGNINDVKNQYAKKEFEITFDGNMISLTSALWTGFEIVSHEKLKNGRLKVLLSAVGDTQVNDLIKAILPSCKIWSVIEKIPSMHEIFIEQVKGSTEEEESTFAVKEEQEPSQDFDQKTSPEVESTQNDTDLKNDNHE